MSETTYMSTIDRDLQERQAVALERLAAALEQSLRGVLTFGTIVIDTNE